jgi:hypothetical protein
MTANLEAALRLGAAGFRVFPCRFNKNPLPGFLWKAWATNDVQEVKAIWDHYRFDAMPAVHIGPSGLVVVDLDRHATKDGVLTDGVAAFDALLDQHGELPPCPVVETPSGGYHLFFKQPEGRAPLGNREGDLPDGINVRGVGGYVIGVGSVKDDGTYYACVAGCPDLLESFVAGTIPPMPGWLVDLIEAHRYEASASGPSGVSEPITDTRARAAGLGSLDMWAARVAATGVGGRNNALNDAAFVLGGNAAWGHLSEAEVRAALWAACVANGYIDSKDASDGPRQFEKTFRSGWNAGLRKPLAPPRDCAVDTSMIQLPA